jgi:hypothetical protein
MKVGDRVIVNIIAGHLLITEMKATIVHIDERALYVHEFCPIQVELDEPYDDSGQTIIRCSLKEVRKA